VLLGQAAEHIMSTSLELGGNGPFIVLDDADIDAAVEQAVVCKFRNAGQACVAANRIIVDSAVADEFTRKFVAATERLTVGNGFDGADVGPIISRAQRDRAQRLVATALEEGATLLTGGDALDGPGNFFAPTVFAHTDRNSQLAVEEIFAPIAVIYTAESIADAIEFANDTDFGLAAYLFTKDLSRALGVAERLDSGMVGINRGIMADPAAPFGGVKASGLGREGGDTGIHEFLEQKYIALTIDEGELP
jgi:succinate-semialdehyde dehydrogenase/glutarate-semialdehyde dehydrogenase